MSDAPFANVEHALAALGCDVGAAECHGMLSGMLSGPRPFEERTWLAHVVGELDEAPVLGAEQAAALRELVVSTRSTLDAADFGFDLLLPGDAAPLPARVAAFGAWCRGYLSGLGLSGIDDIERLGEEAREFVHHVERFGTVAAVEGEDEQDERALLELTEFTRMGVLTVVTDARALTGSEPDGETLE